MTEWNNPYPRGTAGYDAYNRAWQAARDWTPPSSTPSAYDRVQGYDNPHPSGSSAWDAYNREFYPKDYPDRSTPDSYSPNAGPNNPRSVPPAKRGRRSGLPQAIGNAAGWVAAGQALGDAIDNYLRQTSEEANNWRKRFDGNPDTNPNPAPPLNPLNGLNNFRNGAQGRALAKFFPTEQENQLPQPRNLQPGVSYRIRLGYESGASASVVATYPWQGIEWRKTRVENYLYDAWNWYLTLESGQEIEISDVDYGDHRVSLVVLGRSASEVRDESSAIKEFIRQDGGTDPERPDPVPPATGFQTFGNGVPGSVAIAPGLPGPSAPPAPGRPDSQLPEAASPPAPGTEGSPTPAPAPTTPATPSAPPTTAPAPGDSETESTAPSAPPVPGTAPAHGPGSDPSNPQKSSSGAVGQIIGGLAGLGTALLLPTATPTTVETATVPGSIPPQPPPADPPKNTKEDCPCNKGVLDRLDDLGNSLLGGTTVAGEAVSTAAILDKLNKMDDFATKAWRATHIDKVINALSLITALHNASMLSRDLAETLFYLISSGLDALGIEDSEGNALDIGSIVGGAANSFVRGLLGEAFVDGAVEAYRKANRIVQSASAIIWAGRSLIDTSLDLQEWIGENLAYIGNGLKNNGVVGERSYPWMSERPQVGGRLRTRIDKFTGQITNATDRVDTYTQATSAVIEIQEESAQLVENFGQFQASVNEAIPDPWLDNEPVAEGFRLQQDASASPPVDPADAQRG